MVFYIISMSVFLPRDFINYKYCTVHFQDVLKMDTLWLYQCSAARGWRHCVFGLFVRSCVNPSRMLLMQYLEKYWTYFCQTFSIGTFWEKGDRFQF